MDVKATQELPQNPTASWECTMPSLSPSLATWRNLSLATWRNSGPAEPEAVQAASQLAGLKVHN